MAHQPASGGHSRHQPTDVVVGIDGSATSTEALSWAVREARLRGVRLRLLNAYGVPLAGPVAMAGAYHEVLDKLRTEAEAAVAEAFNAAADAGVEVSGVTTDSDPSTALVKASETAGLLVVGSRGLGGFTGRVHGSVSGSLPGHVHSPVAIIPGAAASRRQRTGTRGYGMIPAATGVVVGIDGSVSAATAALEAAGYAQRRGLALTLLCALPPVSSYLPWRLTAAEIDEYQTWVENEAAWITGHYPALEVSCRFYEHPAMDALAEASATADLVVLGNRGRGGFAGLILGSTSQGVAHHLRGPILIVPHNSACSDPRLENRMHAKTRVSG